MVVSLRISLNNYAKLGCWGGMAKTKLLVCTKGKSCRKRGGRDVFCALAEQIDCLGLSSKIKVKKADCLGHCGKGPTVQFKSHKMSFSRVSPADCPEIIRAICKQKKSIARMIFKKG
jgi:(2Fe-2S) ferredoxin